MKKVMGIIVLCLLLVTPVFGSDYIVEVGGERLNTEIKIVNNRTLISLRDLGEALGLAVTYNKVQNTILLESHTGKNSLLINLNTGLADAAINGDKEVHYNHTKNIKLEVPPKLINGKVYVPIRFVCDMFSAPINVGGAIITAGNIFASEENLSNIYTQTRTDDDYIEDIEMLMEIHDYISYYINRIIENPYDYMGNDGKGIRSEIQGFYRGVNDVPMNTIEGVHIRGRYEELGVCLSSLYGKLVDYKILDIKDYERLDYWIGELDEAYKPLKEKARKLGIIE